jgi:hypothetical protein
MRKYIILLFLLVALPMLTLAMDVKVLGIRKDKFGGQDGYWIDLQYTMPDNTTVINPYSVLVSNLIGKSKKQADYFIKENIRTQVNKYLKYSYPNVIERETPAVANYINNLAGTKFSFPDVVYYDRDLNYDGRMDSVGYDLNGNVVEVITRINDNNNNVTGEIMK